YTSSQSGITYESTNAAGCVHTETLNLTITESTAHTTVAEACDTYTWAAPLGNGQTYTASVSGITYESTNAAGCVHTETLNLTITESTAHTTVAEACDTYTWAAPLGNGQTYTASVSGITYESTNAVGCVHTETLNLTITESTAHTTIAEACDTYTWAAPLGNGQTYTASVSGITYESLNAAGCVHTETLNLTINETPDITNPGDQTACDSFTLPTILGTNLTGNEAYYDDSQLKGGQLILGPITTTQIVWIYDSTLLNNDGGKSELSSLGKPVNFCSDEESFMVTINNSTTSTEDITACDSYTWNEVAYTESGVYTFESENEVGCINTATLNLTINYSTTSTEDITACDSYTWNEATYTESGVYTFESENEVGCINTATLNLTINNSTTSTEDITACDSYTWNEVTYTESGVYTFESENEVGCINTATLNLTINNSTTSTEDITACDSYTWNEVVYIESGVYTFESENEVGCINTATLNLTINNGVTEFTDIICDDLFDINGDPVQSIDLNNYLSIAANDEGEWVSLDTSGRLITGSTFNVIDLENGIYNFTYTSSLGCVSNLSLEKDCIVFPCSTADDISKVVTANNDGVNDTFRVGSLAGDDGGCKYIVKIFNRWGKIVFESNDYKNNWGGYHNNSGLTMGTNNKLPTGTYYYIVNVIVPDGELLQPITGYIYLGTN
uniref:gliding motility-associated C-terminal domain-containing protein n=1 Tax=Lutibacter sp. TaxID=1925666 RepID=UPI0035641DDA